MKEFADDYFKVDENGRKFSKWIENTVGKREIALAEQFLLFPQCFQKAYTADTYKLGLVWERVKEFADNNFEFDENGRKFYKRVENSVGKKEIAH